MPRKPSPILAIFLTVLLDLLAFGLVIPDIQLRGDALGAHGAVRGLLIATFSIAQLLTAPFLGRLSDRIGRRSILLFTTLLATASMIAYAHATELWIMFVARALSGVAGANIGVAYAYIADVTPREERAKGFGIIGIAFGLGFILGPPVGAFLLSRGYSAAQLFARDAIDGAANLIPGLGVSAGHVMHAYQSPSPAVLGYVAAGLAFVNFLYVYRFLPEPERHEAQPARGLLPSLRIAFSTPSLGLLMLLFFAANFAFSNLESTYFMLSVHHFGLTQVQGALILTFVGVVSAVMQGYVIRIVAPRYGEVKLIRLAYLCQVPALLLIPFAPPWLPQLAVVLLLGVGAGLAQPSLGSLISQAAPPWMQGGTFGLTQALGALARILGPLAGNAFFDVRPWLPYALASLVMLIPLLGAWRVRDPAPLQTAS